MSNFRIIAEMAGVSIATVSRHINKSGYVSEEAAQKIENVIKQLNYVPNKHAKAIFTKTSSTIGLIIPNICNLFFTEIARAIEKYAQEHGYSVFLCDTYGKKDREKEYVNMLLSHRVDGIIIARGLCHEEYEKANIPVVSIDGKISDNILNIISNNYLGGIQVAEILHESGCKNILHIRGPKEFQAANRRYDGFKDKLNELNLTFDVIDTNDHMLDAEKIKDDLFKKKYDGVFVWNDMNAALILSMYHELGIKVPDDVQVIGFDNIQMSELVFPKLTTITQQTSAMGRQAIKVLIDLIKNKDKQLKDIEFTIDTKKVIRDSTKGLIK